MGVRRSDAFMVLSVRTYGVVEALVKASVRARMNG